ncbi:hypothetical protein GCM10023074_36910 [Microbispora amethystogenes]|uniref:Uncharacterized protein n=1 Tax=Microbispora amethystogenes TaxID=1427754 RepID=A0ABQ4FBS6_9ACTN|nr:hypothetical protein Mam01_24270 [Microbispora amethystogenes]
MPEARSVYDKICHEKRSGGIGFSDSHALTRASSTRRMLRWTSARYFTRGPGESASSVYFVSDKGVRLTQVQVLN